EERRVGEELGLLELTDEKHRPFLPLTFVLDSRREIVRSWCGFWYWGNPTPEELRQTLRAITRREQPTFDPQAVWDAGGAAPAAARGDGARLVARVHRRERGRRRAADDRARSRSRSLGRAMGVPRVLARARRPLPACRRTRGPLGPPRNPLRRRRRIRGRL